MKNRPKYIEKQLTEVNDILRAKKITYENKYDDNLFVFFTQHLLSHGWYRGFNMYVDMVDENGNFLGRGLAGPDYMNKDHYIQIW